MKNLIRVFTFLTLVAAFSVASASAQTIERFKAEIPFAFNIGAKSYNAGTYVMKVAKATVGNRVALESRNKVVGIFFTRDKGDTPMKTAFLKFVHSADANFYLSKIQTSERSLTVAGGTPKANVKGGVFAGDSAAVSINLSSIY